MIVRDFYYKGATRLVAKEDNYGNSFVDDKDTDFGVRYVGTDEEIEKLNDQFVSENKHLYVDEVYAYEIPKKGTYWYKHHCYGTPEQYKEKMKIIKMKLMLYKERYKKDGAFIV